MLQLNRNARPQSRTPKTLLSRIGWLALTVPFLATFNLGGALSREENREKEDAPYAIGLWGDIPYSEVQNEGTTRLIEQMNSHTLAFSVHNGDLKAGSKSLCDDAMYARSVAYLNALKAPAAFTPGDNDWTDCDRDTNGGYSSRERLDYLRQAFFSTPSTLGKQRLVQTVQTESLCLSEKGAVPCVENRRWTMGKVTYATLHIVGSCNNLCDSIPDPQEYQARNRANIKWMRETFAVAKENQSVAVMFISQANPGWDKSDPTRAPVRDGNTLVLSDDKPDGYKDFLLALREETIAFRKPVAYVHGDTHYYRIDKPFLNEQGQRLENFTRVETFGGNAENGNNDVQWLKAIVDPHNSEVFSYQAQIVPSNRVAVPAPTE